MTISPKQLLQREFPVCQISDGISASQSPSSVMLRAGLSLQAEASARVSKLQKEKDFLAQTSESLLRNQDDFRTQLATEQAKIKDRDAQVADLTEQVGTVVSPFLQV